ncbi:O-antigen ligase family protein [Fusobacterium varium]|uniref:O-antigen ligase family protein n=1 Tax=Fusobacterium varium TaxID=856 RepID=UPI002FF05F8B
MSFFSLLYSKKTIIKIISGIIFLLSFLVLMSTNSRITLLTIPLIILITLLIKFKIKFKYLIIFFILGICFIKEPHLNKYLYRVKRLTSIENIEKETRIKIWLKGIDDFKKNKSKALGFYYYNNHELGAISWEKNPHLHNNFLEIMVTQGIGAIIFYISFNIFLLLEFIKKLKSTQIKSQKILIYLSISILVFLNLTGLTDCNIYFSKVNQLAFFVFALALCKVRGENTNE